MEDLVAPKYGSGTARRAATFFFLPRLLASRRSPNSAMLS